LSILQPIEKVRKVNNMTSNVGERGILAMRASASHKSMMLPTPPPTMHVAAETALLECDVMLLAWKVSTPETPYW
jgi:hypothetical protein